MPAPLFAVFSLIMPPFMTNEAPVPTNDTAPPTVPVM